jgi:transaldolase
MTSNPTIFEKAIASSSDYDADIQRLTAAGKSAAEVFEVLAVADVQAACDLFRPVWDARKNGDGTVSLEVSPTLAHDTAGTITEAQRLWERVGRPNVMIKIPGTKAGLPAITECLARGINVNVTLLFSVERHREVIEAFFQGLERRAAAGEAIDRLCSVASFFVSRVDGKIDPMLDAKGAAGADLRGTVAIANAAAAYGAFEAAFRGPRWDALAAKGAQVQRPLWASTSTKDPKYPDTYYVEALAAPHTDNTLPPDTFSAYRDHGNPVARIGAHVHGAEALLALLAPLGIDLAEVTAFLEKDGVEKFAASYQSLLARIAAKAGALATT